jgi:nucleotide-binding universal stress UspA family protein
VRVLYVIPNRYRDEESTFARLVVTAQLQLEIEDARQRVPSASTVRVRAETVWGDAPAEEIVRYVEAQVTDLLVLGTHGYGAIGRALIGSVASKVVRAASCPMLLVPPAMWVSQG